MIREVHLCCVSMSDSRPSCLLFSQGNKIIKRYVLTINLLRTNEKKHRDLTCPDSLGSIIMNLENQNVCQNVSQRVRTSDIAEVGGKPEGFKLTITFGVVDSVNIKDVDKLLSRKMPCVDFHFLKDHISQHYVF